MQGKKENGAMMMSLGRAGLTENSSENSPSVVSFGFTTAIKEMC